MTEPSSFTCPRCHRAEHDLRDAQFGYCATCDDYTGIEWPFDLVSISAAHTAAAFDDYFTSIEEAVARITPEQHEAALQRILRKAHEGMSGRRDSNPPPSQ